MKNPAFARGGGELALEELPLHYEEPVMPGKLPECNAAPVNAVQVDVPVIHGCPLPVLPG